MKTITQEQANKTVNEIFTSFQKWRSIEAESEQVGLFDNPMAGKFFKATLKLVEMNRNVTKMELYNLSFMGCKLYPAINLLLGIHSNNEIDLQNFLDLREFEIVGE